MVAALRIRVQQLQEVVNLYRLNKTIDTNVIDSAGLEDTQYCYKHTDIVSIVH